VVVAKCASLQQEERSVAVLRFKLVLGHHQRVDTLIFMQETRPWKGVPFDFLGVKVADVSKSLVVTRSPSTKAQVNWFSALGKVVKMVLTSSPRPVHR